MMETTLFENAKFGDRFITRDGKHIVLYIGKHTFDKSYGIESTLIDIDIEDTTGSFRCLPSGRIFSHNMYEVKDDEYTNLDVVSRAPIDANDVYKWLRQQTCCGLLDAKSYMDSLIEAIKHRPTYRTDSKLRLVYETDRNDESIVEYAKQRCPYITNDRRIT